MITPEILSLDGKSRITVPIKQRGFFTNGKVYGIIQEYGMCLGRKPIDGIGIYEEEIDSSGRLLIVESIFILSGLPENDPEKDKVIWIPTRVRQEVEFLLFFGEVGKNAWLRHLQTRTHLRRLTADKGSI